MGEHEKAMEMRQEQALKAASLELKGAMDSIPYLKEAITGGELAKLAFEYLKTQAPEHVKADASSAWNVAIQGRF